MKFYSIKLNDSNTTVCFSEYNNAKKFIREIDFVDRFSIATEEEMSNLKELTFPKHSIDILEVEGNRGYNFIYSSVCMSLDNKNHKKFKLEMYPIQDIKRRKPESSNRTYYSIVRRDKEGNFKSKSEVYINEQDNQIRVDLYIPVGKFTEYVTGSVIAERLIKQIEKYRNVYFSNKFIEVNRFESQYKLLVDSLKKYFIKKEHGEQIISSVLKIVNYTKEKTKNFPNEERIKSIEKIVKQLKKTESNSLFLLELISDLIREKTD